MTSAQRILGATMLGTLAFAPDLADAQITENGPYYAKPSWDQQIPTATRFIILSDWGGNAVLDRETGLVWERTPSSDQAGAKPFPWSLALHECHFSTTGGRTGWRLPSVEEITSLTVNIGNGSFSLPTGHPFDITPNAVYWTASTTEDITTSAYAITFPGFIFNPDKTTNSFGFWCVRGGSGVANPF